MEARHAEEEGWPILDNEFIGKVMTAYGVLQLLVRPPTSIFEYRRSVSARGHHGLFAFLSRIWLVFPSRERPLVILLIVCSLMSGVLFWVWMNELFFLSFPLLHGVSFLRLASAVQFFYCWYVLIMFLSWGRLSFLIFFFWQNRRKWNDVYENVYGLTQNIRKKNYLLVC